MTIAVNRNKNNHHFNNESSKERLMTFSNIDNAQRISNGSGSAITNMDWHFDLNLSKFNQFKQKAFPFVNY